MASRLILTTTCAIALWGDVMSLFQEQLQDELDKTKQQVASVGVTPEIGADRRGTARSCFSKPSLNVPMSPIEKMMERDGKGKTMAKMLLGGFTGMTPFLMPELIGGRARYEQELKDYAAQQKLANTQAAAQQYQSLLFDDDPSNDLKALQMGAVHQPDVYGPVLRDRMQRQFNPTESAECLLLITSSTLKQMDGRWSSLATGERQRAQPCQRDLSLSRACGLLTQGSRLLAKSMAGYSSLISTFLSCKPWERILTR